MCCMLLSFKEEHRCLERQLQYTPVGLPDQLPDFVSDEYLDVIAKAH